MTSIEECDDCKKPRNPLYFFGIKNLCIECISMKSNEAVLKKVRETIAKDMTPK